MCETIQLLPILYKILLVCFSLFAWSALSSLFK